MLKEEKKKKTYEIIGMIVTHKKWGEGLATEYDKKRITIDFDIGEKTFHMPEAFKMGFLRSEYPDFLENIAKRAEIDEKIESFNRAIKEKKEILETLIIQ